MLLRVIKIGLCVCGFIVALGVVSIWFVSFPGRVDFSLSTYSGQTTLDLYASKFGVHPGPHADNSDSYTLVFPSGLKHVRAGQISYYSVNYQELPNTFSESSGFDLKVDSEGCEISIALFHSDGRAAPFNGVHRTKNCGQEYLSRLSRTSEENGA